MVIHTAIIIACHLPLWAVPQPVVLGFDRFPNDTTFSAEVAYNACNGPVRSPLKSRKCLLVLQAFG